MYCGCLQVLICESKHQKEQLELKIDRRPAGVVAAGDVWRCFPLLTVVIEAIAENQTSRKVGSEAKRLRLLKAAK